MEKLTLFLLILLVGLILFIYQKKTKQTKMQTKALEKIKMTDGYLIGRYLENGLVKGKKYIGDTLFSEGTFYRGVQIGQGYEYYPKGLIKYSGHFENGLASGQGKLYEENGKLKYNGNFNKGYAYGYGKIFDEQGHLKIEGNFKKLEGYNYQSKEPSAPWGKCREYYQNGKVKYDGEFKNGLYHGYGSHYDYKGKLIYRGNYRNGSPVKK